MNGKSIMKNLHYKFDAVISIAIYVITFQLKNIIIYFSKIYKGSIFWYNKIIKKQRFRKGWGKNGIA
mgnify:CR=1 FL=1